MITTLRILLAISAALSFTGSAWSQPQIRWQLENPFRLLLDRSDLAPHRMQLDALTDAEQRAPIVSIERRLADQFPRGWAATVFENVCWDAKRERYGCGDGSPYAMPRSHRVVLDLSGLVPAGQVCEWTVEPSGTTLRRSVQVSCSSSVTFEVPFPAGAVATVTIRGLQIASTKIAVRDIFIVGIGDSYASGDGDPDLPIRFDDRRSVSYGEQSPFDLTGYPARDGDWRDERDPAFHRSAARWFHTPCHRSLYGHQTRVALQLALEDPHRAVTFATFACWGSEITKGIFLPYPSTSLVPGMPSEPQLSSAAQLQCGGQTAERIRYPRAFDVGGALPELADLELLRCPPKASRAIDLLLVTVGGNDVGFAQLVANAIVADHSLLRKIGGWLGVVRGAAETESAITRLPARFKALNRAFHNILHVPWDQSDRIILTAYPPLTLTDDGKRICGNSRKGMTVMPEFALDELRASTSERVGQLLYRAMVQGAAANNWMLADGHRAAYIGRGICAGATGGIVDESDELRLPRLIDGIWRPYPPSQWQPYAARKRLIRTPNDGYLTVHFQAPLPTGTAIQLLLAASYSGAFHPTAEGQAVMADAVLLKARAVLSKYDPPAVR